jgi:hypothetical protein
MTLVFPVVAALVATTFAVQLARRYAMRRRPHALAWCLALGLYAAGSTAVAVGVGVGWSAPVFRTYWLAGPLLNVPLLAVGQLLLLAPGRARLWWLAAGLVALVTIGATVVTAVHTEVLQVATSQRRIPLGRDVLGGSLAYRLARPCSFTFLIVVLGSVWSAIRTRRPALLLIAAGVTIVAGDSAAIRRGNGELFSLLLATGITVMYAGFLAATRQRAPSTRDAGSPTAEDRSGRPK